MKLNTKKFLKWNEDSITRAKREKFIEDLKKQGVEVVDL